MLVNSMSVYSWPASLKNTWKRALITSFGQETEIKTKLVNVVWRMICKPYDQGGLPLRALSMINKASNLKLCWDLANSVEDWTILLKAIVLRGGFHIHHHVPSSIWSSIKGEWEKVSSNSIVIIGNCTNTNF